MDANWRTSLWQQFGAAIDMLGNAVAACPDALWRVRLWDDAELPESAAFWYIVYHTLFWLDLYLSGAVEGFAPPAPFTLAELDPAGLLPEKPYTRDELRGLSRARPRKMPGDDRRVDRRAGFTPMQVSVGRRQLRRAVAGQHASRPGARRAVEPDPGAEGRLVAQVGRADEKLTTGKRVGRLSPVEEGDSSLVKSVYDCWQNARCGDSNRHIACASVAHGAVSTVGGLSYPARPVRWHRQCALSARR